MERGARISGEVRLSVRVTRNPELRRPALDPKRPEAHQRGQGAGLRVPALVPARAWDESRQGEHPPEAHPEALGSSEHQLLTVLHGRPRRRLEESARNIERGYV